MDFDIEEIEDLSGRKAHIYSIRPRGSETTLLEDFFSENESEYETELDEIWNILYLSGHELGCRPNVFKPNEGNPGDGVCALRLDCMRLYCLVIGSITVILGSGGYKDPAISAYQEDETLNAKAEQMKHYAKEINKRIKDRDITIDPCNGKLTINNWED